MKKRKLTVIKKITFQITTTIPLADLNNSKLKQIIIDDRIIQIMVNEYFPDYQFEVDNDDGKKIGDVEISAIEVA